MAGFKELANQYDPYNLNSIWKKADENGTAYTLSQDYAKKKADEQKLNIVTPDDDILQLDIDSVEQWKEFKTRLVPAFLDHTPVARIYGHAHLRRITATGKRDPA